MKPVKLRKYGRQGVGKVSHLVNCSQILIGNTKHNKLLVSLITEKNALFVVKLRYLLLVNHYLCKNLQNIVNLSHLTILHIKVTGSRISILLNCSQYSLRYVLPKYSINVLYLALNFMPIELLLNK